MDREPFLPKSTVIPEDSHSTSSRPSPNWRDFSSNAYFDLIPPEAIIPVIRTPNSSSYVNLLSNLALQNKKTRKLAHRSHSAPSVFTQERESSSITDSLDPRLPSKSTPLIVQQAFVGVILYLIVVVVTFLVSGSFKGTTTFKLVDALYFTVVTLCTIGYGDIVPETTFTKLFTCVFILVGFGFIDILLNGLVTYICDKQEAVLLSAVDENLLNTYMIDRVKGRMRIRTKVCLAIGVVIGCIAIGTITVHFLEKLSWIDSFYLSVTSVTTVGYGDYAFTTVTGRCFAIIWLLISTLAVARAFLYLAELRIDKRNRRIAKWILQKKITLGDLVAADLDNDGSISASWILLYLN
ncbi:two-pore potassium channel 3 isoform X2 [Jatropha curcas]|uniref:two-pore potassium channel 3 isoform X2 n=1 Tax=Jatropha curcas TaxID=180498 RepID=UPI0009D76C89|nr:two-pore potassium channel 3 isoform X2 [Jatropha curcas]